MDSKLSVIISALGLGVLSAFAYSLGWLKNLYYYKTFGIDLRLLDLSTQDHLVESWFVLENVAFFFVLFWFVIKAGRWWAWALLGAYFLLPIISHYAFLYADWRIAGWLIKYRHTILKFLPFVVLFLVWLLDRSSLTKAWDLSWNHGGYALALFIIVIAAWSISAAKHFGSFDANRALRFPTDELASVTVYISGDHPELAEVASAKDLYLVCASPSRYFLWDHAGFEYGRPKQNIRIFEVPRDKVAWIETRKPAQVQPGGLLL